MDKYSVLASEQSQLQRARAPVPHFPKFYDTLVVSRNSSSSFFEILSPKMITGRIKMSSTSHFIHQLASEPNNAVHFPWGSVKYHRSTVAAEYRRSPSALPSFVIYLRDSFDVERANEQRDTTRICVHRVVNNVSRDRALLICLSISSFFSVFFSFFLFFFVRSKVLVHPESPLFSALAKRLIRLETRNIERCRRTRKWLISGA